VVHGLLSSQKTAPSTGACRHPAGLAQVSMVQSLPSLQSVGCRKTQLPLEQTLLVHGSPSSQTVSFGCQP
jgi:hypothetical protein